MKIVYVGNHGQLTNSNDDEGSIAWSLRKLGHTVVELRENSHTAVIAARGDLVLFHKWEENRSIPVLKRLKTEGIPAVFWYFDLVDSLYGLEKSEHNEVLRWRTSSRTRWMEAILPHVKLGFCTDGDWVKKCQFRGQEKLVRLCQGMDPRLVHSSDTGVEDPVNIPVLSGIGLYKETDVLFVGGVNGYPRRLTLCNELRNRYGDKFCAVGAGPSSPRIYGSDLKGVIANSKIVIAPDSPVTDNYWSNRVYTMLGYQAFLLHPFAEGLTAQYKNEEDLVFYKNRQDLFAKIDKYLGAPQERDLIAAGGHLTTRMDHTYLHRCEQLLAVVKERLGVG